MQEESAETVCSDSNGLAEWLCPLCQQGQPDRESLSLHLTDRHSVLPTCVDKLLDIAAPKQCVSGGEGDTDVQKASDAVSSLQLKHISNSPSDPCKHDDESAEQKKLAEGDAELDGMGEREADGGYLESDQEADQPAGPTVTESPDDNEKSTGKNDVAAENDDSRPFKCNACLESFPTRTALSVHYNAASHIQRMKTGSSDQDRESDNPLFTPPRFLPSRSRPFISTKPYQCAVCRVSYNHAITLESHMKSVLHQTRSRNTGNTANSPGGNSGSSSGNNTNNNDNNAIISSSSSSNSNTVPNFVVTSGGGATQLVTATSSNCVAPGNLATVTTTAKDGEQIQTLPAPSLLSSPVASPQAVSAFLTLLTSSPSSLSHSLLPSLFAAGAAPGAATPQLIPQPQMLMPFILNGLHAQGQSLPSEAHSQLLTQSVPVLGLNAAQQALLAQRLSTLQNQWPTVGLPAAIQTSPEDSQSEVEKMEEDGPETPFGARSLQTEQEDNWTIESGEGKREMNKDDKDLAQQLEAESKNSRVETCMRDGDDEMAEGDCTDGGNLGVSGEVDKCGGKMAKPNLTISPIATDMAYLSDNCSHNSSFSPRSFNLALSSDSTPQKTQAGTSPCTTINTLRSSPFRGALTVPDKSRRHRNLRGWPIFPGVPILSEFQSQVLLAFLESRSEADAASPPYEDCEALGREVGLTEGEVRKWLSNARNAKERQKAAGTQNRCSGARYTKHARENENDDDDDDDHEENVLTIVESESSGSQAMDLSSSGAKKRREIQGDSGLTSDSDNEEVYTSVIVSDEDSQSVPMREEPESPAQEETQKEPIGDKGSGGGKVLRSTTVFLSDAEDEDDEEEEGGAPKPKRKKRKRELEPEEIKRERLDPDVDLELEAQADPPNPLPLTMDHPGLPGGILHSLSLSLAPFSTQFISPYVLSLPSSMVGLGVAEGGGGKGPAFPNPPHITRFSDHLITSPLSYSHTSQYLSNGGDGESALDLSMGSKHGSKATSSTSTLVDRTSVQKGRLLDGLGLRPTAKGLIVVQVKPDSAGNTSASNSGGFVNSNNMSKPSTVYMRAAERMSATILEREKERAKEQEREKDKDPRRPKGKRYRDMRRSRTIIQAEQLDVLYGCYFKDPNPGKNEFEQISEWVHLPKKVVQIWFQNMRARERKGEVRFVSDGTLAAVGKPLIKFTWPLSKPIFNSLPKTNSSGTPAATSVRPLVKQVTEKEQAKKEMEIVKTPNQVPLKSTETATSTVASMSSSVSAVPKIKLETTSNTTMVKIAPKVTPPIVPAVPKESLSSPSGLLQKCKVEVESENEEKTDEEDAQKEESIGPVTANRMVPRMTSTPVTKPPAAVAVSQKQNGLNYWSSKGPFKINTLSREQLGLPSPPVKPRTITPAPLHTMPTTAPATSTSTTASSGTDAPATTTAAAAAAARVPKPTEAILHHANSRRPRTHLSCLQLSILQSCYETCAHPNALECEAIGTELGLPLKVVQIWFQNTRAKEKRWRLQQEKVQSPSSDPSKKIDTSSGSYLQYNALRANRPILPKPVQLTVVEPSSPPVAGQPAPRETLRGRCEACNVGFQSRAAARAHVFSPRHLATLRTTNFGQPATAAVVNNNGSVTGSSSVTGSGGETVEPSPPPASSTS